MPYLGVLLATKIQFFFENTTIHCRNNTLFIKLSHLSIVSYKMELNWKLNPSFQDTQIPTEHPLLVHVCAIAYTCKSNCLFMYKQ